MEHFESYLADFHEMETQFAGSNGYNLHVHTEISMIDGKMAVILQGDSGSFCHYCKVSRKDANDLSLILQGFPSTKSFDEIMRTWELLEAGEIPYNHPDRAGQCHAPITKQTLRFFYNSSSETSVTGPLLENTLSLGVRTDAYMVGIECLC